MKVTILVGGKAGDGPNILTQILGESLVEQGYYVFYSRDYQSLIRGGHNFNTLTFSDEPIHSNDSIVDVLIAFDDNTLEVHKKDVGKNTLVLRSDEGNMYFAGYLFKFWGLDFKILENKFKKLSRFDENIASAKKGYDAAEFKINLSKTHKFKANFFNGSRGIALGAVASGLDLYYAYPMTPATPALFELAQLSLTNNHLTVELENEIAVVNAAIGSSILGKKVMVGTSGGGFDLMTESLSLTGIAETPVVFYLSMRPGPGTGVATYTSQGDLKMALHSGHGEFPRVVVAPGDPIETESLVSECFYFSHKFFVPSIILSDKHLGESVYTIDENPKITKSVSKVKFSKFNSYEANSQGCSTEDSELIKKNVDARLKKQVDIGKESKKFKTYKIYGNKKSKNVVVSWGSTKGAVIDAIKGLDVKFVQVLYLEPFADIKKEIEGKNLILVENSSKGSMADLISENFGIFIKNKILRYDGRPFFSDELKKEIQRRLK
jgi:2-oxoglutarate/2-oxoacid ferredoxin oxidoreductase subunit alpha